MNRNILKIMHFLIICLYFEIGIQIKMYFTFRTQNWIICSLFGQNQSKFSTELFVIHLAQVGIHTEPL